VFRNAASTLRRGVELALESDFSRQWRGRLSLTRLQATYDSPFTTGNGGSTTATPARHPCAVRLCRVEWKPRDGLAAAVETYYRSKLYVEDTNTERAAPAYTLVNLRLAANRIRDWTFGQLLRVDNLFDREHIASVIVGDGNGRFYEPGPTAASTSARARATASDSRRRAACRIPRARKADEHTGSRPSGPHRRRGEARARRARTGLPRGAR